MARSESEFWKRLSAVSLLSAEQLAKLQGQFDEMSDATTEANRIAEQLVAGKVLTPYQARILLGEGPVRFDYGPYRVIDHYTGGCRKGMYAAIHRPSGHFVDLDLVPTSTISSAELAAHCQVHHPGLVTCYEVITGVADQTPVVLERVTGNTLVEAVNKKRLSAGAACRVLYQVADAVFALHAARLVHGQLCAAAVVVSAPTQVKVLRRPGQWPRQDEDSASVADYLRELLAGFQPPESIDAHQVELQPNCDVYALGQILHYLVVGRAASDSTQDLAAFPESLRGLVAAMISREPHDRLSHAGVVAALLADYAGSTSSDRAEDASASDDANATSIAYANYLKQHSTVASLSSAAMEDASATTNSAHAEAANEFEADRDSRFQMMRHRRQRLRRTQWIWGTTATIVILAIGYLTLRSFQAGSVNMSNQVITEKAQNAVEEELSRSVSGDDASTGDATIRPPANEEGPRRDDGDSPWASPTSGEAIDLRYVPSGAQLILYARPRALLNHAEGSRCLAALGPRFQKQLVAWEEAVGLPLTDVEELRLAMVPRDASRPESLWVIHASTGTSFPSRWAAARTAKLNGYDYFVADGRAVWPVEDEQRPHGQENYGPLFVMGPEPRVRQAIESDGAPVLRRDFERLHAFSDREQNVTILFAPSFLRVEGSRFLAPQLYELCSCIAEELGDETRGCLCSFHLQENQFFGELRLATDRAGGPAESADLMRQRIGRIPLAMETAIAGLPSLDPYWRRLALRSVRMTDVLRQHSRVGVERRHVVANFSLPAAAAHNLLLAVELTTAALNAVPLDAAVAQRRAMTMDDLLQTQLSLDIPQQSMEFALRDLAALVDSRLDRAGLNFTIRIDGPSLQAEGITRNQEIRGFRLDNTTVADLLTALVMKANPVTTVTAPHEPDQKLVWVIPPEPNAGGDRIIIITTRKAVQQNGYSLPSVFQPK